MPPKNTKLRAFTQVEDVDDEAVTFVAPVKPAPATVVRKIALDKLEPNPHQPRRLFDELEIRNLADSIEQHGLLQPIKVAQFATHDAYWIVMGERRFRAHQMLGRTEIEAIVVPASQMNGSRPSVHALIENVQRVDLNPMELALSYREIMQEDGLTQAQLARQISKDQSMVARTLQLLDLPESVQKAVLDGELEASKALVLHGLDEQETNTALAYIKTAKPSREKLKKDIRTIKDAKKRAAVADKPAKASPTTQAAESANMNRAYLMSFDELQNFILQFPFETLDEMKLRQVVALLV
jgi:ParB family chromosome partitioning protein